MTVTMLYIRVLRMMGRQDVSGHLLPCLSGGLIPTDFMSQDSIAAPNILRAKWNPEPKGQMLLLFTGNFSLLRKEQLYVLVI